MQGHRGSRHTLTNLFPTPSFSPGTVPALHPGGSSELTAVGICKKGCPLVCTFPSESLRALGLLRERERVGQGGFICHKSPPLKSLSLCGHSPGGGPAVGESSLHTEALQGLGTNSEVKHVSIQWPHLPTHQCPLSSCSFLPQLPFRMWCPLLSLPSPLSKP